MFTSVSLMSLLRSLVLDLDLDLELFWSVDKLHKTDEAVTAKIANNPKLAKALTNPNLTPTQKQQLATELVSSVMVELPLLLSIFA
jgi:hypothetical protein